MGVSFLILKNCVQFLKLRRIFDIFQIFLVEKATWLVASSELDERNF